MTRAEIIADVRARLHEPVDGRYFDDNPEMFTWLNEACDEVARKIGYEKYIQTFSGGSNVAALGDDPKYYELPGSAATSPLFVMLDPDFGVLINGIRMIGTTNRQMDAYQEAAYMSISDGVLEVPDYFHESYTGAVINYTTQFILRNEIDAGRTGRLMTFMPNPSAGDIITYRYICLPTYMASAGSTVNLMRQFQEALPYGLMKRAQEKLFGDGLISKSVLEYTNLKFDMIVGEAADFMVRSTAPDKRYKAKTAKQLHRMYNTQRIGRWNDQTME